MTEYIRVRPRGTRLYIHKINCKLLTGGFRLPWDYLHGKTEDEVRQLAKKNNWKLCKFCLPERDEQ
jgi:hypothetical protein